MDRRVHAEQIVSRGRNEKYRVQWLNTLRDHAFPHIGSRPVRDVVQSDVLRVLAPIWTEKPQTARLVRQRLRTVLNWARTAGHFEGVNPVEGVEEGLANQTDRVKHYAAMPWGDVPGFMSELGESVMELALRVLILTAARSGEVRGARWSEIDTEEHLWIIPADRMKSEREHRVPLSDEALAVLEQARGLDSDLVFPGQKRGRPMPDTTLLKVSKRMGLGVTIHGFRSSFRDWAEERGGMPREIAELSLAHEVGSATERAYRRSDLLEKRRTLMERWAWFCDPAIILSLGIIGIVDSFKSNIMLIRNMLTGLFYRQIDALPILDSAIDYDRLGEHKISQLQLKCFRHWGFPLPATLSEPHGIDELDARFRHHVTPPTLRERFECPQRYPYCRHDR